MKAAIALSVLAALALTGCAQPGASNPQSRASAAQVAACRQSADQTVLIQNPGTVYQSDAYVSGTESTPFSGQGLSGNLTGGLPQRYARQEYYDNCLNGIGPAPAAFSPPSPSVAPAPLPSVTSAPLGPAASPTNAAPPPANLTSPPANLTSPPP